MLLLVSALRACQLRTAASDAVRQGPPDAARQAVRALHIGIDVDVFLVPQLFHVQRGRQLALKLVRGRRRSFLHAYGPPFVLARLHVNAPVQLAWLSWSPLYWPPNIAATSRKSPWT